MGYWASTLLLERCQQSNQRHGNGRRINILWVPNEFDIFFNIYRLNNIFWASRKAIFEPYFLLFPLGVLWLPLAHFTTDDWCWFWSKQRVIHKILVCGMTQNESHLWAYFNPNFGGGVDCAHFFQMAISPWKRGLRDPIVVTFPNSFWTFRKSKNKFGFSLCFGVIWRYGHFQSPILPLGKSRSPKTCWNHLDPFSFWFNWFILFNVYLMFK